VQAQASLLISAPRAAPRAACCFAPSAGGESGSGLAWQAYPRLASAQHEAETLLQDCLPPSKKSPLWQQVLKAEDGLADSAGHTEPAASAADAHPALGTVIARAVSCCVCYSIT